MLYSFDFEVFSHDWLVVIKNDQSKFIFHNDQNGLREWIKTNRPVLVGFNNYHYDDKILYCLLTRDVCTPADVYSISKRIINDKFNEYTKLPILTLDVRQELEFNLSLKAIEGHLGWNIVECSIPWDIERKLTQEELDDVIKYCIHDVDATTKIWKLREDYFDGKANLVEEFNLDNFDLKKSQAVLSSIVLESSFKFKPPKDRLCIEYDPNINWDLIPKKIKPFFDNIETLYRSGRNAEKLERNQKLYLLIAGVVHKLGFGGLHGAIKYYAKEGNFLHIDVTSYYPSLMINNNWISRACKNPKKYEQIRDTRFALKRAGESKEYIYKIILNSTYGATKAEHNSMFDPKMANNICANGQIILIQLIHELQPFCKLIQSNTDGLIVEVKDQAGIDKVLNNFTERFNLGFSKSKIKKIVQRDVNNYAIQYYNNHLKTKGIFALKTWENNSLNIVAKCLQSYFFYEQKIDNLIFNSPIIDFQIIAKRGSKYKYIEQNGEILQNVNRVFATKTGYPIFKVKENGQRDKIAHTSEKSTVWNTNEFSNLNLDREFYKEMIIREIKAFHNNFY